MKKIPLSQSKVALVDGEDFVWLSQWKWCFTNCGYAGRTCYKGNRQFSILMHRDILRLKFRDGKVADHINGNTLDNRKTNLRLCTLSQNSQNMRKRPNPTHSKYKGVTKTKNRREHDTHRNWMARIKVDSNKRLYLGRYKTESEAAKVYNKAAIKYFGEFARLNIILE